MKYLTVVISCFLSITLYSQNVFNPFYVTHEEYEDKFFHVELNKELLNDFLDEVPYQLNMMVPVDEDTYVLLDLKQKLIYPESGLKVTLSSGQEISIPKSYYFSGKIMGLDSSSVNISIYQDEIRGVIMYKNKMLNIKPIPAGLRTNQNNTSYIVFDEKTIKTHNFQCQTGFGEGNNLADGIKDQMDSRSAGLCNRNVGVYLEVDYQSFLVSNDIPSLVNEITNVFSNVNTHFNRLDNDPDHQIFMYISELFIWDTPDNYFNQDLSASLCPRLQQFSQNRPLSGNNDLACLVHWSHTNFEGGMATSFGGSRCTDSFEPQCAGLSTDHCVVSMGQVNNPNWNVGIDAHSALYISHELAHLLGAFHTQCCVFFVGNSPSTSGIAIEQNGNGSRCEFIPPSGNGTYGNSDNNNCGEWITQQNPTSIMSYSWHDPNGPDANGNDNSVPLNLVAPFHPENVKFICECIDNPSDFGNWPGSTDSDGDGIPNSQECAGYELIPNSNTTSFTDKNGNSFTGNVCKDGSPCTTNDLLNGCNCIGKPTDGNNGFNCNITPKHDFENEFYPYPISATGYGGAIIRWLDDLSPDVTGAIIPSLSSSPDIISNTNQTNRYLHIFAETLAKNVAPGFYEGFVIPLCNPLQPGCSINITGDYSFYNDQGYACNIGDFCGNLLVQGTSDLPCYNSQLPFSIGYTPMSNLTGCYQSNYNFTNICSYNYNCPNVNEVYNLAHVPLRNSGNQDADSGWYFSSNLPIVGNVPLADRLGGGGIRIDNSTCEEIRFLVFSLDVFAPGFTTGGNLMLDNIEVTKLSCPVDIGYGINGIYNGPIPDCENPPCNTNPPQNGNNSQIGSNPNCCRISIDEGQSLDLYGPTGYGYCDYQWTFNGNVVSNDIDLNLTLIQCSQAGIYELRVTDEYGCMLFKCIEVDVMKCFIVKPYVSNEFCGQNNAYVEFEICGIPAIYSYTFSGNGITPVSGTCNIPNSNIASCTFSTPQNLTAGKYNIQITSSAMTQCVYSRQICIEDIDQTIIRTSGGDAGFHNHQGVNLNAGTQIAWSFNPYTITDRLRIKLGTSTLVNTQAVTNAIASDCVVTSNVDRGCDCSNFYNQNYSGSFTLSPSGNLTVEVDGDICMHTGTAWLVEVCCINGTSACSQSPSYPSLPESNCNASITNNPQSNVSDNSATILYNVGGNICSLILEYRPYGNPNWNSVSLSTSSTNYTLNNLQSGVVYEYRLKAICCNGTFNYSNIQNFFTDPCGPFIYVNNYPLLGYITPGL